MVDIILGVSTAEDAGTWVERGWQITGSRAAAGLAASLRNSATAWRLTDGDPAVGAVFDPIRYGRLSTHTRVSARPLAVGSSRAQLELYWER